MGDYPINWAAIEAIGTILAVVVALGLALFREVRDLIKRPSLTLLPIAPGSPDCVKIPTVRREDGKVVATADVYYLRMRVKNQGRGRATEVEVFASKLLKRQADGKFREVESFLPMNLRWAHRGAVLPGISPNMYRHCAIAAIFDPRKRPEFPPKDKQWSGVPQDNTILSLSTETRTNARGYLQPPGTYRLELELVAANAKPVKKILEITLTGDWYDDEREMFSEGVGIRLLR
jgi:hypothetical protein